MSGAYYDDGQVQLHHGEFQSGLPLIAEQIDLVIADPPTGETSHHWDKWPDGWPAEVAKAATSMWVFASTRTLLDRVDEFSDWTFSHDIIWEKHNGTGFTTDRFRRVHEQASFWYRGAWADVHHETPRLAHRGPDKSVVRRVQPSHTGTIGDSEYVDDGMRLARSVQRFPSVRGGLNATEKPVPLLELMIRYGSPLAGLVAVPFSGSAAAEEACRNTGRRAIGWETRPEQLATASQRLAQDCLDLGSAS